MSSFLQELKSTTIRLVIGLIFAGITWIFVKGQIHKMTIDMENRMKKHSDKAEQGAAANP
jgi:hypothetical protein